MQDGRSDIEYRQDATMLIDANDANLRARGTSVKW